jgi:hypothetical protein
VVEPRERDAGDPGELDQVINDPGHRPGHSGADIDYI